MTRIYYDTEFLEDGHSVKLISIGMIAEDGRQYYAVTRLSYLPPLRDEIERHPWLVENVLSHLPDWDDPVVKNRSQIRDEVRDFILATPMPELWAWYAAYDHVALCQLFGRMIDLPDGVPMWTNDLRQECLRLGNPIMPKQTDGEHHALADAMHAMVMGEFLRALAK